MKTIIRLVLSLAIFILSTASAAVINGPVSGQIFNLIDQQITVDVNDELVFIHDSDVNLINTTISGDIGASLIISTQGSIFIDENSQLVFPDGSISLVANSIGLSGSIDIGDTVNVPQLPIIDGPVVNSGGVIRLSDSGRQLDLTGGLFINSKLNLSAAAVPIPPAFLLFGSASLSLFAWSRKFKQVH